MQVRDEIDANLGHGLSSRLLQAMCRYRLGPTLWLHRACPLPAWSGALEWASLLCCADCTHPGSPAIAVRPGVRAAGVLCVADDATQLSCQPWAQTFREPLHLQDRPQLFLDERTDEERRFPELFRQSVQQCGACHHTSALHSPARMCPGQLHCTALSSMACAEGLSSGASAAVTGGLRRRKMEARVPYVPALQPARCSAQEVAASSPVVAAQLPSCGEQAAVVL